MLEKLIKFQKDNPEKMILISRPFSHIIFYYSQKNQLECSIRAESLLNQMIEMWQEGFERLAPNLSDFTNV